MTTQAPRFARRHYEAIAEVLRVATKTEATRDEITNWICDLFASDNARFNRARFLAATRPRSIEDEMVPTGTGRMIRRRDVAPVTRRLLGWDRQAAE